MEVEPKNLCLHQAEAVKIFDNTELLNSFYALLESGKTRDLAKRLDRYLLNKPINLVSLRKVDPCICALVSEWIELVKNKESVKERYQAYLELKIPFNKLRELRIMNRELRQSVLELTRSGFAQGDISSLEAIASWFDIEETPLFELPLYRSRLLFADEDYRAAIQAGLQAVAIKPDDVSANIVLMRSAFRFENYEQAMRCAEKLVVLKNELTDDSLAEVKLVLERVPVKALVKSRTSQSYVETASLLNLAGQGNQTRAKAMLQLRRIQRDWIRELVSIEKHSGDEAIKMGVEIDGFFPNVERVLNIVARNLVKQRLFAEAEGYWARLLELDANNEAYQFQLNRCNIKIKGHG